MSTYARAACQNPSQFQVDLVAIKARRPGALSSGDPAVVGTTVLSEEVFSAPEQRRQIPLQRFSAVLLVAVVTAASLSVLSPAKADTGGPIRNAGNQKCLTPVNASQGAAVVQRPCDVDRGIINRAQEWDALCKDASCSVIHMVNHESLLCLDVRGGATNGTPIQMWPCNGISNENWDYGANSGQSGSPNFVLRSRVSGTRSHCLDVPGSQAADGLAMQLWGCNGTAAQLWISGPGVIE